MTEQPETTQPETESLEGAEQEQDGKVSSETQAREAELRKRIEELRKRDPFVYK